MKKQGAKINNIAKALSEMIFQHAEDLSKKILLKTLLLKFHVAKVY